MPRRLSIICSLLSMLFCAPTASYAQFDNYFGKNKVVREKCDWKIYDSDNFRIRYCDIDLTDENQKYHFLKVVERMENSYVFYSRNTSRHLRDRVSAVVYKSHSTFEQNFIVYFLFPEGVRAFAESELGRLVSKLDSRPEDYLETITHEIAHIFYYSLTGWLNRSDLLDKERDSRLFVEGMMAEFSARLYSGFLQDDVFMMIVRGIGANPEKFLPPVKTMERGDINPYVLGFMVAAFIYQEFGEAKYWEFIKKVCEPVNENKHWLVILSEITNGNLSMVNFDQRHRDFWAGEYARAMLDKQRPYHTNQNFAGQSITPAEFPFYTVSPAVSPDGLRVAAFTVKDGEILIETFCANPDWLPYRRDPKIYSIAKEEKKDCRPKVIFKKFPPNPYEYFVVSLETGSFEGSDLAWLPTGEIAFFARKGADHIMVLIDSETGKVVREISLPLNQASSPSFSPDGKTVFFTAARNIDRDIHYYSLENNALGKVTGDREYESSPAVSPKNDRWIVYVGTVGGFHKLFLLDRDTGSKVQLTFNGFSDEDPSWSDDGRFIVFTSDEQPLAGENESVKEINGRFWNIYTMELFDENGNLIEKRETKQWTDFFGRPFTPKFAKGRNDLVVYSAYWQYDQVGESVFPNFKLFKAELRKPVRQYEVVDNNETMEWMFRPENLFQTELDENQIGRKAPAEWHARGRRGEFGYNTYWGAYANSRVLISDLLEERHHSFLFGQAYSFRLLDYSYLNQQRRLQWGYTFYNQRLPLFYPHYDIIKGQPEQLILNNMVVNETSAGFVFSRPVSKFHRFEFGAQIRKRGFELAGSQDRELSDLVIEEIKDFLSPSDYEFYKFFRKSDGHSLVAEVAYRRDTIIYSYDVLGPLQGNALMVKIGAAPRVGKNSISYMSLNFDARRYMHYGSTVLAVRGAGAINSTANGDFVLMGGSDLIPGIPYRSIAGNQGLYGRLDIRIPFIDAVFTPVGAFGPIRGLLFADYGVARFSDSKLLSQKGRSYGLGFQFVAPIPVFGPAPLNLIWANADRYRTKEDKLHRQWRFDLSVSWLW